MEQYVIKGGTPLVGEVSIAGAKNAALGILAAAIMTDEEVVIENVPNVRDTRVLLQAIEGIGAKVKYIDEHTVKICGGTINPHADNCVDDEFIRKIRASYYLLGAMLGKYKRSSVALPGGCNIGSRPIDLHIKGFKALGADVDIHSSMIHVEAEQLIGNHIYMDVVSVGATINVMMAAVLAEGKTTIENAAKEPHIVDVANFLNSMGANIKGAGTDVIRIRGVEKLKGTEYSIIPDQRLRATNIKTLPYPGFPTDMQPQMAVVLALSEGTSIITESIFENRFKYVDELFRMGGQIKVEGNTAIIDGVERFVGANVVAPDLRAGAALVIAGLAADGFTEVEDIKYIQRGYEAFDEKIRSLGGQIAIAETDKEVQKFKLKVG